MRRAKYLRCSSSAGWLTDRPHRRALQCQAEPLDCPKWLPVTARGDERLRGRRAAARRGSRARRAEGAPRAPGGRVVKRDDRVADARGDDDRGRAELVAAVDGRGLEAGELGVREADDRFTWPPSCSRHRPRSLRARRSWRIGPVNVVEEHDRDPLAVVLEPARLVVQHRDALTAHRLLHLADAALAIDNTKCS